MPCPVVLLSRAAPIAASGGDPIPALRRVAVGDHGALDVLARWAQPVLVRQARCVAAGRRGALAADELVDEVVAEVQAFLATGTGGGPGWLRYDGARAGAAVEGWLFGVVRNKVRRRLRGARRAAHACAQLSSMVEPAPAERPVPERALDAARALRLAAALPRRERAALELWLSDAPAREIAARLRFSSPHAVECCLTRGKQRLRRWMDAAAA